jgi:hypothetical protein
LWDLCEDVQFTNRDILSSKKVKEKINHGSVGEGWVGVMTSR